MKKLKLTGLYRDGGSEQYEDEDGKEYWRDLGFGSKERGQLLYHGHPNKEGVSHIAYGIFELTGRENKISIYKKNKDE